MPPRIALSLMLTCLMAAPAFHLKDAAGNPVSFDPAQMQNPLVLTFFHGGWCPFCNLRLAELRKAEGELERFGFDNWFISVDRPELLYASLDDPDIRYRVLSDAGSEATRAFGIAFRVSDDVYERHIGHGVDLEEVSGRDHHVLLAAARSYLQKRGSAVAYTVPSAAAGRPRHDGRAIPG